MSAGSGPTCHSDHSYEIQIQKGAVDRLIKMEDFHNLRQASDS